MHYLQSISANLNNSMVFCEMLAIPKLWRMLITFAYVQLALSFMFQTGQ